jgi:hypothetical protein
LALGPDLADGRRLLFVATDNDFQANQPSLLLAFAIRAGDIHSSIQPLPLKQTTNSRFKK